MTKTYILSRFEQVEADMQINLPGHRRNCLSVMDALIEFSFTSFLLTLEEVTSLRTMRDEAVSKYFPHG